MSLKIDLEDFPISQELIEDAIDVLTARVIQRYPNGCTICGILVGALPIVQRMQDIFAKQNPHLYPTCFIGARSYVDNKQKDAVGIYSLPSSHLFSKKNVVLVDDVIDTGNTAKAVARVLGERFKAKEVNIIALCVKGDMPPWVSPEAVGFELPKDQFIIGYGMDYNGEYRDLKEIRPITEAERAATPAIPAKTVEPVVEEVRHGDTGLDSDGDQPRQV